MLKQVFRKSQGDPPLVVNKIPLGLELISPQTKVSYSFRSSLLFRLSYKVDILWSEYVLSMYKRTNEQKKKMKAINKISSHIHCWHFLFPFFCYTCLASNYHDSYRNHIVIKEIIAPWIIKFLLPTGLCHREYNSPSPLSRAQLVEK